MVLHNGNDLIFHQDGSVRYSIADIVFSLLKECAIQKGLREVKYGELSVDLYARQTLDN